jgi:4-amino-4-deoxy-L-arabinose transferase-like glycosyltransferase
LFLGSIPVSAIFFSLFLFYNYVQTGHPFLQPFQIYNPNDHLGFSTYSWKELSERFDQHVIQRGKDWVLWTGGMPLLLLVFLIRGKAGNSAYRMGLLLALPALCLFVGYYFYIGSGVFQYGPRYLYESYALMLIPAAIGLLATRRWVPWILALIISLNSFLFLMDTDYYRNIAKDNSNFFKQAGHLSNAVVFIRAEDLDTSRYFLRNGSNFKGPVLFALDRGPEENRKLIRLYPDRSYYICVFPVSDWQSSIKPYNESLQKNQ